MVARLIRKFRFMRYVHYVHLKRRPHMLALLYAGRVMCDVHPYVSIQHARVPVHYVQLKRRPHVLALLYAGSVMCGVHPNITRRSGSGTSNLCTV